MKLYNTLTKKVEKFVPNVEGKVNMYRKQHRNRAVGTYFSVTKILIVLVAVLFVANIVLCSTAFYYLKHGKVKNVNYYYPQIEANQESISTYAMTTALMSTICVSAGGNATDYDSFFTHTLSKGSGVIYRVDGNVIYFRKFSN